MGEEDPRHRDEPDPVNARDLAFPGWAGVKEFDGVSVGREAEEKFLKSS